MTLSRSLAIVGLLLASVAPARAQDAGAGQTGEFWISIYDPTRDANVRLKDPTETSLFFNAARCNCDATVKIMIEQNPNNTSALTALTTQLSANGVDGIGKLYVSNQDANCVAEVGSPSRLSCVNLLNPDDDSTSFKLTEFVSQRYWTANISMKKLFSSNGECGTVTAARRIVFYYAADNVLATAKSISLNLALDTTPPAAPTGLVVKGGNNNLKLSWDKAIATSDTSKRGFIVFCRKTADGLPAKALTGEPCDSITTHPYCYLTPEMACNSTVTTTMENFGLAYRCSDLITPTQNEFTIRDLANNVSYDVTVGAMDRNGNISAYTTAISGTPQPTVDFWTNYKNQGGQATGGCSMGSATHLGGYTLIGVAGLGLVIGLRRRRGKSGWMGLALVSTLGAGTAQAQAVYREDAFNNTNENRPWAGSPRNYAFELRWGPFRPDVDSEFGEGADKPKPYAQNFGTKKHAMWQVEFDWELLQTFGTFAVGFQAGYFKVSDKACYASSLSSAGTCLEKSDDTISLNLYPFAALAIYRFDVLADRWKIPLVPYAKLGLNYTLWVAKDDAGNTVTAPTGDRGRGATTGWQYTLGISLRLDFLDPSAARAFDGDMGVNHTYAFFELTQVKAHGLGGGKSLRVGDNTWFGGLMFEF